MTPRSQPNEPELYIATTAVMESPGQRVMYPLCPYHDAWNPGTPDATLVGGGMPGPTVDVQAAAFAVAGSVARTARPTDPFNARRLIESTSADAARMLASLRRSASAQRS